MNPDPINLILDFVRKENEYVALRSAIKSERSSKKTVPLPHLVNGLSDGAVRAVSAALICDHAKESGSPALLFVADEKMAAENAEYLRRAGVVTKIYPARDLNLYNITASHDYEHERLSVLHTILRGECDCVITTPDAALS